MSGDKEERKRPGAVEIFATEECIHIIDSPVRVRILSMLRNGELSFDEIVSLSGRVKSTVSVHLKCMMDEGVISSRADPDDKRKKIFFINSGYLGRLSRESRPALDLREYTARYVPGEGDPLSFYRLMLRVIRVTLMYEGINVDPVLHQAGLMIGETLYDKVKDEDVSVMLANIARFWKEHGLGDIRVSSLDPVDIFVYDCFECKDLPVTGKPSCAFDSGVLEAIFTLWRSKKHIVFETECYTMGNGRCRFVIKVRDE